MNHRVVNFLSAALSLSFAAPALAQVSELPEPPELDAQRFRPTMDSRKTLWTESSGFHANELIGSGRLWLHYANSPLVWVDPVPDNEDDAVHRIVSDALGLNVVGSAAIHRFRLGVDLPIYLVAASGADINGAFDSNGAGLGDLAIDGRATALDRRTAPLGLGLSGRLILPTATVQTSLGIPSGGVAGEIMALIDTDLDPVYLSANLGTRLSPTTPLSNIEIGNQFVARLGGAYTIPSADDAGVSLDLNTNVNFSSPVVDSAALVGVPIEVLGGGWYRFTDDWVLRGGIGRGLTEGIGSPAARVILSIAYERPLDGDKDRDLILDSVDACPAEPEDRDEFEDENGCPDPDNDIDGIVDASDSCPNRPEDADGFRDDDGCPDEQVSVKFKVLGWQDVELPEATLSITGPEQAAGAHGMDVLLHEGDYKVEATAPNYEVTAIEFGVPKQSEVVVRMTAIPGSLRVVAMDPNGKMIKGASYTLDGAKGPDMPEGEVTSDQPSGTHTIVVRAEDYAPYKHSVMIAPRGTTEVVAILTPTKVKLTRDKIEIADKVFFDTGLATIKPVSFQLLNEVAQIIQDYPEIVKVRIEGHTDSRGSDVDNQKLSDARAASVRDYLHQQGVALERMNSIGYGESKPLVKGENSAAWDKNRRVEFFVEEWNADLAPEGGR